MHKSILFLTSLSILSFLIFLINHILPGLRCYLIIVLIYISLMINDVKHFSTYLLVISMLSLENNLFSLYAYFNQLFVILSLRCRNSICILGVSNHLIYGLQISSPIPKIVFHFAVLLVGRSF